jgi:hypothetical protein
MRTKKLAVSLAVVSMMCVVAFSAFGQELKPKQKWGFLDETGKEVIPYKYDMAFNFTDEGFALVQIDSKFGIIDKKGREIVPCKYYNIIATKQSDATGTRVTQIFYEGLAIVRNGTFKDGYIDTTGKEVIPCQYAIGWKFSEGLAKVMVDNKWGYIDKTGNQVIPCKYDSAEDFSNGVAEVKLDGKKIKIDKTGQIDNL